MDKPWRLRENGEHDVLFAIGVRKEYGCELGWAPDYCNGNFASLPPLSPKTMLKHFNAVPIQIFSFFLLSHTCP